MEPDEPGLGALFASYLTPWTTVLGTHFEKEVVELPVNTQPFVYRCRELKRAGVLGVLLFVAAVTLSCGIFGGKSSSSDETSAPSISEPLRDRADSENGKAYGGEPGGPGARASLRVSAGQFGVLEHDSGARMEIPKGALTEAVTVSISEVEPPLSPARVGRVYDFSVADTPILAPITLHIPFELQPGAASSGVVPLHWDEDLEVWEVLEGEVLESSNAVAVTVLDLSMFTVSGRDASDGNQPSTIVLAAKPRIVEVEAPGAVVVDEPFDVHWIVQNEGPLDLVNIREGTVGYVRLLSPTEIEGWRRGTGSGGPGIVKRLIPDWWLAGHSYSSEKWEDESFTITPSQVGPLTVRVELVFQTSNGDLIGRDVVEHEVHVTTHRSISPATVFVEGREYRVSSEPDSRGVTEYIVEDAQASLRVRGSLRDKAVFTAYIQQTYRSSESRNYSRAFRRFERAVGFKELVVIPAIEDLKFGVAVSTGIGFIIASPNLFAKAKAAVNVTVDVLLKIIREFTDNAEKVTEEVALREREITLELQKEKIEITTRVQDGRPMSFADALRIANGDTYSAIYFPPAEEARRMIARRNYPSPEDALKTVAGELTARVADLPVTSILKLDDALSALKEFRQPLSMYEPWEVMTSGVQANIVAERAGHASFLSSLGISDHAPFQLPVLTDFTFSDYSRTALSGATETAVLKPGAPSPTQTTTAIQQSTPPAGEFASVSAGTGHTCGVMTGGTVACWGSDYEGRATPPAGEFVSISAGAVHTCGVMTDGAVACWGSDRHAEFAQATAPPAGEFTSVSAGWGHTCGVMIGGAVACWGDDRHAEATPPAGEFASVSAGTGHTCGVMIGGAVACWGDNGYGQSTPPAGEFASVSAGAAHTCGVMTGGAVACWGDNGFGQSTPPAGEFASVSAGAAHTCGVMTGGTVACWGDNGFGRATSPAGEFASVSAGVWHTCGLLTGGAVACWGDNDSGQATPPAGEFASVSTGWDHICGVLTGGAVLCWGEDDSGQATPPAGEFASLSAGAEHTCGVLTGGAVLCWGEDDSGQATPPAGEFASLSAGAEHTCGVLTGGAVLCWGEDDSGQATPPAGEFASLSAGAEHTCGVLTGGAVACWGDNGYGEATPPAGEFAAVSAGRYHTCGVMTGGAVACWGGDSVGQATPPAGDFASVSAGVWHTCGLLTGGVVACWGDDSVGQATPPAGEFASVSAGAEHTCGVMTGGAVACWGRDARGITQEDSE